MPPQSQACSRPRPLVVCARAQVQHAKRAYEVKHGLVGMRDPMHFFDDHVEDGDADEADADADADDDDDDDAADDGDDVAVESGASE